MKLDKWTCNSSVFHNSVVRIHPELAEGENLELVARKYFNDNYVTDSYKTHQKELNDAVEKMRTEWLTIEESYFKAVDGLFNHPWPEGKYICYLSIFNCNPRFIETKEFQAYYKHPETTNHVCAHEMLHFIFYDYVEKNFSLEYRGLGEKVIWKLSEIFNDVVLRLPEFAAITGQSNPGIYAETRQELDDAIKLWEETKSVKAFITKYLESINKTDYKFIPSETLPKDLPISAPLTFAFIGENLVLTKKNGENSPWGILGGELKAGESWTEGLKRKTEEEAGVVIDYISVVGYLLAGDNNTITPITVSFVQEVKKEWRKNKTLVREHFCRKWAKKALLERVDNGQLAEIFKYVLTYWENQKYEYTFDFLEGDAPLANIQNTGSNVFVRTPDNNFLIVRDFDENFFSLPGGGCDIDEDGRVCAIREVREEAQVELKNIQMLGSIVVKVSRNGQVLSMSTQQRYLADAVDIHDFKVDPNNFDEKCYETVERKVVPFELLGTEVKSLRYKTGEAILASLKRMVGKAP